jgi:hypothetical protein
MRKFSNECKPVCEDVGSRGLKAIRRQTMLRKYPAPRPCVHPELDEASRRLFGSRYVLPKPVAVALEQVFAESVDAVFVIEHSRYARAHRGMLATTRPNRILLAISGTAFIVNPELLLHEYFHVLRQWRTGRLTRWRYVVESARCGYWANQYEGEAREFAGAAIEQYRGYLRDQYVGIATARMT